MRSRPAAIDSFSFHSGPGERDATKNQHMCEIARTNGRACRKGEIHWFSGPCNVVQDRACISAGHRYTECKQPHDGLVVPAARATRDSRTGQLPTLLYCSHKSAKSRSHQQCRQWSTRKGRKEAVGRKVEGEVATPDCGSPQAGASANRAVITCRSSIWTGLYRQTSVTRLRTKLGAHMSSA